MQPIVLQAFSLRCIRFFDSALQMQSLLLVFPGVSFEVACKLRLCCKEFAANSILCRIVARNHILYPALTAGPGGTRVVAANGKDELEEVLSLVRKFQDATSLSAFFAPEKVLGEGPMSVVDLRRHRVTGCFVAVKS